MSARVIRSTFFGQNAWPNKRAPVYLFLSLLQATAYIFTDMQTSERHTHAFECYNVTAKRCGALLQWINQVIMVNETRI